MLKLFLSNIYNSLLKLQTYKLDKFHMKKKFTKIYTIRLITIIFLIFIFIGCTANKEGNQIIKEGGDGSTVVNKCFKQKNI